MKTLTFTDAELAHIKAALIIMRDIDAANDHDEDAQLSAELIYRLELEGV
jgi:hypothetical protein